MAPDSAFAGFDIGALDRSPSYPVRPLFLARLARMRGESVVERLATNILSMTR